jgi:hypothetical protein
MTNKENGLTLEAAIGHCESVDTFIKQGGSEDSCYGDLARYLRRLRYLEEALKKGELVWKEEKTG